MGHSASIIATPMQHADALLAVLHLTRTERPDNGNMSAFSAGVLQDHCILWRNWRVAHPRGPFSDEDLRLASGPASLLVLDVCETTMFSSLRRFDNGQRIWIAEASDGDEKPLSLQGPVSPQVDAATIEIRANLSSGDSRDAGDFEVPVRAFQLLTGHRYDEVNDASFVVLESARPAKKPFWKLF